MLDVEGAVADVLRRALLLVVVAGTELLGLDVRRSRLVRFSGAERGQLAALRAAVLAHPGSVAARVGRVGHAAVPVRGQVLVELVDVERLYDVAAELADVHVAEVDVERTSRAFLKRTGLSLQIRFAWLHVSFRGGGRSGRPLGLACLETVEEGRES